METNNIELLEAYMGGTLTPEEQLQVESRLKTDPAFKQDYEIYHLMLSAIAENRKRELKTFISKNVKVRPAPFFKVPTFYAAAAASVVLCLISYFVIYKKLNEQNISKNDIQDSKIGNQVSPGPDSTNPVADYNSQKGKTSDSVKSTNAKKAEDEKSIVALNDKDVLQRNSSGKNGENAGDNISSNPEDVKVVGDKMESDTFLDIARKIYIPKPKSYKTSREDSLTLITTGDTRKLEIQFWQSPINYTGYKFSKNLLIIYGNFDPALANFQELKDVVYMKYKKDYYKISFTETYTGMKKETDAKVIADLEKR